MGLKLFVWADPWRVSYGSSVLYAVAETEAEARQLACKGRRFSYTKYEEELADMTRVVEELGHPTRVVDVPCAEYNQWSE